ncbi:hypothetical protein ACFQO7_37585, partial [Catellatospora aurea]
DAAGRADIGLALALSLFFNGRSHDAVDACMSELERRGALPRPSRQVLRSGVMGLTNPSPDLQSLAALAERMSVVEPTEGSVGGLTLDAVLSLHDAFRNDRASARERALRAIAKDRLITEPAADSALACAWQVLDLCDAPEVLPSIEAAAIQARRSGSLQASATVAAARAAVMLSRGSLKEAIENSRVAWEAAARGSLPSAMPAIANLYVQALLKAGENDRADMVMAQVRTTLRGAMTDLAFAEADMALALSKGEVTRGLDRALATRRQCDSLNLRNPLSPDWRSPLIECLRLLGRGEEAQLASAAFTLAAQMWHTPRAMARAMRAAASLVEGSGRISLLSETVQVLDGTQARLEQAETMLQLGEALLEIGEVEGARRNLRQALALAEQCWARPMRQRIMSIMGMAGSGSLPQTPAAARRSEHARLAKAR